ncbi:VWA domain-containing protein [Streptomyces sp. V4-01]|uniref:VWA domain-containing protein n=1 Tax=Actinacidiphila polyblastidii TaxID=3110430 RepID=A0ABU7P5G5_9ACTN|nr:VWA domain-containing protein [Streptomyces sp. V4-01]
MRRRGAGEPHPSGLFGSALLLAATCAVVCAVLAAAPGASAAPALPGSSSAAAADGSLIMVLDSSGSMAGPDGSGHTRIAAARTAIGSVVDALPDGYPTGLRVYGAGRTHGCDDTSLAQPVTALDRAAVKSAVAAVRPEGDTPTALALTRAAADLPAAGRRTLLLVSDGASDCGTPKPCQVAARLADDDRSPTGLRIDTVGFQVAGDARSELECVARAGHGAYYDAPDAAALTRELVRAAQLSAEAYRLEGARTTGGASPGKAAPIAPGQYLDTIGPGETRWYAATLDALATDDLSATAVPQPGVPVDYGDGIELRLSAAGGYGATCDTQSRHFGQDEGAMTLTGAVSRIPDRDHGGGCGRAGRYLLSVHRTSAAASDPSRWPIELRFEREAPLPAGTVPAAARTDYGPPPAPLTGAPRDRAGGTGFNDATPLTTGVWRDRLLPAQLRYYKVHVGWGQQLSYTAEFANAPVLDGSAAGASTFVVTRAYAPDRLPVTGASDAHDDRMYDGSPASVGVGTVPVSWTNRWVDGGPAQAVHRAGDYWIAVGLGPDAAQLARDTAVGVVLRVQVTGEELTGPQYRAPALAGAARTGGGSAGSTGRSGDRPAGGTATVDRAAGSGPGGITGTDMIAAGTGGAAALAGVSVAALVQRTRNRTDRGGI